LHEHGDEYGFLILALAQLVSIFAFWFGSWPQSFGLPERLGLGFALFFFGSGVVGFYLSFRVLSRV
jgi:hypothetical protein